MQKQGHLVQPGLEALLHPLKGRCQATHRLERSRQPSAGGMDQNDDGEPDRGDDHEQTGGNRQCQTTYLSERNGDNHLPGRAGDWIQVGKPSGPVGGRVRVGRTSLESAEVYELHQSKWLSMDDYRASIIDDKCLSRWDAGGPGYDGLEHWVGSKIGPAGKHTQDRGVLRPLDWVQKDQLRPAPSLIRCDDDLLR